MNERDSSAYGHAQRFIRALPLDTPDPTIDAEPDGDVSIDWHGSPPRTLSVSVNPEGMLHYAAFFGVDDKSHGTIRFCDGDPVPQEIVDLIARVYA